MKIRRPKADVVPVHVKPPRTLDGRRLPDDHTPRTWEAIVGAPERTVGGYHDPAHPSRKHDAVLPPLDFTPAPLVESYVGPLSRRDRRPATVAAAAAARKTARDAAQA